MPEFTGKDLRGSRFDGADLSGSEFRNVDLRSSWFRDADLDGVVMRGVELVRVDINGEVLDLTINGVDVGPLIEAELDRRDPERPKMRPTDPAGFGEAWDVVEGLWGETVARARRL